MYLRIKFKKAKLECIASWTDDIKWDSRLTNAEFIAAYRDTFCRPDLTMPFSALWSTMHGYLQAYDNYIFLLTSWGVLQTQY